MEATVLAGVLVGSVLMALSVAGNTAVIICYSRKPLRNPPNLFLVNLAVCDLVVNFLMPPILISTVAGRMTFNNGTCVFLGIVLVTGCIGSIYTIAGVALTRYVSIVKLAWKGRMTWRNLGLGLAAMWTWVALLVAPPILTGWGRISYEPQSAACVFDWTYNYIYTVLLFALAFGLPAAIIGFSYLHIFIKFRQSKKSLRSHGNAANSVRIARKFTQEMKLAVQLLVIFALFLICWAPYLLVALFLDRGGVYPRWVYAVGRILIQINSTVNPEVYLLFNPRFRAAVMCWRKKNHVSPATELTNN